MIEISVLYAASTSIFSHMFGLTNWGPKPLAPCMPGTTVGEDAGEGGGPPESDRALCLRCREIHRSSLGGIYEFITAFGKMMKMPKQVQKTRKTHRTLCRCVRKQRWFGNISAFCNSAKWQAIRFHVVCRRKRSSCKIGSKTRPSFDGCNLIHRASSSLGKLKPGWQVASSFWDSTCYF